MATLPPKTTKHTNRKWQRLPATLRSTDSRWNTKITAKGYPYAVISRETNEKTGQVTELHILLNEQHERLSNREYVLQKHRFAADGAESASAEIVDFYLVDCATLEVTDEHTTQWHKATLS